MRVRRPVATALLAGMTAVATLAFAQRGKPVAKPPVKPPASKVDASAPAPEDTSSTATADAGAPASTGSGKDTPPPAPEALGDGGVRMSPLNPTAQEMPSTSGVDAGTPVDYDRLLADIAALRARVAAVSDNLYQSRIAITVENDADHGKISKLAIALDDGIVYTAPSTFAASDPTVVYDHAVAPGRHAVTVDVERRDDREESYRSAQKTRFTVDVPRDQRLAVQVSLVEDSSMAKDFPSGKSGKYDLRVKVKAVAKPAK